MLQLSAFRGLTEEEAGELAGIASIIRYPRGELIFVQGSPGDALYAVLEGSVEVRMREPDRKEQVIATLRKGSIFGEISLLLAETRSGTAVAAQDVVLLRLSHNAFRTLLDKGSLPAYKVVYHVGKVLAQRLKGVDEKLVEILSKKEVKPEELAKLKQKLFSGW